MRLSILIFCFFHGTCWTSHYCVHQPKTGLYVKNGDSVTIPCSYTYPKNLREKTRLTVTWGVPHRLYCSSINKYIIDHSGNITDEYKERISAVHHPDNRTASITIRGLKAADGITFCCRVTIIATGNQEFTWYDSYGSFLIFPDGRWVSQMEELIAVPGEEMIIPCHYPLETLGEALQVTWYFGGSKDCKYISSQIYTWNTTHSYDRFSLVNFPEDVSLRLHSVQNNEQRRYCCLVTTSNEQRSSSKHGTELTITGPPSSSAPFTVTQTHKITGLLDESVTLSCSYRGYNESDILWVNIYWRLGNITGPYVYHPYKEMVHPSYRGRTEITGPADLHIRGLHMSDDSTYYCFVVLRFCSENDEYEKLIQYGEGTRLIVTDQVEKKSHLQSTTCIFASSIGVKFFISLVLFLLALYYYKHK